MPQTNNVCYQFGPFSFDPEERVLTLAGETIALTPKAIDILIVLLDHAGQLVEKDELLKAVWPDTFVEEANLTQNVFVLRRALGDQRAEPTYIETVTRRGYRFIGPVKSVERGAEGSSAVLEDEIVPSQAPIVAVLPFVNAARNQEIDYLADSLTSNVINNLSRVSGLRVMSRSSVLRYRSEDVNPQQVGKELGASAVLAGKIESVASGMLVSVELVDVSTGWQMWGDTFDSKGNDLLQIQESIVRGILCASSVHLNIKDARKTTTRYTENGEAHQCYLEGRFHWSRYTRKGVEKAIRHFQRAVELDPNYALAYAGIVDCYLRLATNYLPPEATLFASRTANQKQLDASGEGGIEWQIRLRFEWDWKAVERELRRANDLRTEYPAAHQWHFAYRRSKQLYEQSRTSKSLKVKPATETKGRFRETLPAQIAAPELTQTEQLQVCCAIVREQIDVGNYEAGCRILRPWWEFGNRPKLEGLNQQSCADLLFTAGELAGFVASSVHLSRGQRHGEELLNGSIALFEQLGLEKRAVEGKIELALCYHRQGLFDLGRSTLFRVLAELSDENRDLRTLALVRLASLEREAGHLKDALASLNEALEFAELCGPWITARCQLELASIYKDLAVAEGIPDHSVRANHHYVRALQQFKAVGHHRYVAIVENNMGLLSLALGRFDESEASLVRARILFDAFSDELRGAQVNETLARLYIETRRYKLANEMISRAITVFELADGEALLAEALTTGGIVAARLGRFNDAQKRLESAAKIAERCSDSEGAGLALLIMSEELGSRLTQVERFQLARRLKKLLATTQRKSLNLRVQESVMKLVTRTAASDDEGTSSRINPPEK